MFVNHLGNLEFGNSMREWHHRQPHASAPVPAQICTMSSTAPSIATLYPMFANVICLRIVL